MMIHERIFEPAGLGGERSNKSRFCALHVSEPERVWRV